MYGVITISVTPKGSPGRAWKPYHSTLGTTYSYHIFVLFSFFYLFLTMSHSVELPNNPTPPPPHRPRHQHSRSQQLSSTQPSLTSRRHQQHHSISIGSGSPRGFLDHFLHQPSQPHGPIPTSPLPTSNTSIDIEFDGATQVIIRPNRIVKGSLSSCICYSPQRYS